MSELQLRRLEKEVKSLRDDLRKMGEKLLTLEIRLSKLEPLSDPQIGANTTGV